MNAEESVPRFYQIAPKDAPVIEGYTLAITYSGDITKTLIESGTQCPFRTNEQGDTEQLVIASRGLAAAGLSDDEFKEMLQADILSDARKNGRIKSYKWIDLPKPKITEVATMNTGQFGKGDRATPRTCVLCGGAVIDHGHNPWPLRTKGRCCGQCNQDKVIPARIEGMQKKEKRPNTQTVATVDKE